MLQPPPQYGRLLDPRALLYSSCGGFSGPREQPKLPGGPFRFQERTVPVDWDSIRTLNLKRLIRDCDTATLEVPPPLLLPRRRSPARSPSRGSTHPTSLRPGHRPSSSSSVWPSSSSSTILSRSLDQRQIYGRRSSAPLPIFQTVHANGQGSSGCARSGAEAGSKPGAR